MCHAYLLLNQCGEPGTTTEQVWVPADTWRPCSFDLFLVQFCIYTAILTGIGHRIVDESVLEHELASEHDRGTRKANWCFYRDAKPNFLKMLYLTQVRPLLEYAFPVWDPHLEKDIKALESVQKFAAKMCSKTWQRSSYSEQLCALNLSTLKERWDYLKLCFLYKILNNLVFFPKSPLALRPSSITRSLWMCLLHAQRHFITLSSVRHLACGTNYHMKLYYPH